MMHSHNLKNYLPLSVLKLLCVHHLWEEKKYNLSRWIELVNCTNITNSKIPISKDLSLNDIGSPHTPPLPHKHINVTASPQTMFHKIANQLKELRNGLFKLGKETFITALLALIQVSAKWGHTALLLACPLQ